MPTRELGTQVRMSMMFFRLLNLLGRYTLILKKKNAIFSSIITDPMVVFGSLEFFHERKAKKIICIILSMRTILLIVYVFLLLIIIIIFYIR